MGLLGWFWLAAVEINPKLDTKKTRRLTPPIHDVDIVILSYLCCLLFEFSNNRDAEPSVVLTNSDIVMYQIRP